MRILPTTLRSTLVTLLVVLALGVAPGAQRVAAHEPDPCSLPTGALAQARPITALQEECEEEEDHEAAEPAFVTVVQRPTPNRVSTRSAVDFGTASVKAKEAVPNDGIVDYVIEAVNHGHGDANDTIITLPFDPAEQRVLDATFSRAGAYVSGITASSIEIRTGQLAAHGGVVTATVRLLTRPGVAPGTSLGGRLSYRWEAAAGGGTGRSNQTALVAGPSDVHEAFPSFAVSPAGEAAGSKPSFSSDIFAPGEPVSLWYNTPDGKAVGVGMVPANTEGVASGDFAAPAAGAYTLIAYGHWTQFMAAAPFTIR